MTGSMTASNVSVQGRGSTTDNVYLGSQSNITNLKVVNTNGLRTLDDSVTETITLNSPTFVANIKDISVYANKT